jgi:hypothetical protein
MTYETKKEAQEAGKKAINRILARGKMRLTDVKLAVFENIGWHWKLEHRHFGITPIGGTLYDETKLMLLASPNGYGSGRMSWSGNDHGKHADELLKGKLAKAKAEIAELQGFVDDVEALLIKTPPRTRRSR